MDINTQVNKSSAAWTEINEDNKIKGIANTDKKNVSGQFFCREFFSRTISMYGQFFCPYNFLSGKKGIYHKLEFWQNNSYS